MSLTYVVPQGRLSQEDTQEDTGYALEQGEEDSTSSNQDTVRCDNPYTTPTTPPPPPNSITL